MAKNITCRNCGYVGESKKVRSKVLKVLVLIALAVSIIYIVILVLFPNMEQTNPRAFSNIAGIGGTSVIILFVLLPIFLFKRKKICPECGSREVAKTKPDDLITKTELDGEEAVARRKFPGETASLVLGILSILLPGAVGLILGIIGAKQALKARDIAEYYGIPGERVAKLGLIFSNIGINISALLLLLLLILLLFLLLSSTSY